MDVKYDSLLLFTYGGPETSDEIIPFVTSVLGNNAPEARIQAAAQKYYKIGGISPINNRSRALLVNIINRLTESQVSIPVYWATLHAVPDITTVVSQMALDGCKNAAVFVPAPFETRYMNQKFSAAISAAVESIPESNRPRFTFLPAYQARPEFISAVVQTINKGIRFLQSQGHTAVRTVFTTHSLPKNWEESADYDSRFQTAIDTIAAQCGLNNPIKSYQSQPPEPQQDWLEPRVEKVVWSFRQQNPPTAILVVPLGFSLDNMEVSFDLDYQLGILSRECNIVLFRAATAASEQEFTQMIVNSIQ